MNYNVEEIAKRLKSRSQGKVPFIELFETIESTNSYLLSEKSVANRVCLAENQTKGRGRRGRHWHSIQSGSVLMSMGWEIQGQDVRGLSLVAGLAVVLALEEFGLKGIGLKWPNDLLVYGKKIGGILVELSGKKCVIGLGLNIDTPFGIEADIDLSWSDLKQSGLIVDVNDLVSAIIYNFDEAVLEFLSDGFVCFQSRWNACHAYQDKRIIVSTQSEIWRGIARGVDFHGALVVEMDGETRSIESGEVSVRLCESAL